MLDEFAKTYLAAGNLAAAEKNAEESHAILSRLAEVGESDKDAIRNLSVSLIRLGDVKRAQGDRKAALAAYEETLALDRKRAEADKDDARAQQDVALISTGSPTSSSGRRSPGALAALEEALAIRRELAKVNPNDEELQRAIEVSLGKIGDVKRDAGDAAGALAAVEEELDIARRLLEQDPGNTELLRDVAIAPRAAGRPQAQRRRRGRRTRLL